ncbi:plant neutral invertase family protein [Actinidia rufa]|uniref:Plant neutral invertase family protein n=1 Tax=Actinidia rufa TaxID=165716 RepID=A0A7J0FNT3_9ERIC|nr:plant neutral invertase family protein [Actinidia rufa]
MIPHPVEIPVTMLQGPHSRTTGPKGKIAFLVCFVTPSCGLNLVPAPKPGFISVEILTYASKAARKPSVSAIDGIVLGGGLEVAMIYPSSAHISRCEFQLGIISGVGGIPPCLNTFMITSKTARKRAPNLEHPLDCIDVVEEGTVCVPVLGCGRKLKLSKDFYIQILARAWSTSSLLNVKP